MIKSIFFPAFLFLMMTILACTGETKEKPSQAESPEARTSETTSPPAKASEADTKRKVILFLGNSLTAAYGIDPEQGFTAIIQRRLDSLGYQYRVANEGVSGETTAGGKDRIDWILQQKIDILVLELGGNDGLRGIDPKASYDNLQTIIDKVKTKYPEAKIVIAGMQAPPNMGADFTREFASIFPRLAVSNKLKLIPFLLEGVGGIPELNLPDGIHPTPAGHQIVAENIWAVLREVL